MAAASEPAEVVHVAGPTLRAGHVRRQRCSWCGALLSEYDLSRIARPLEPGEDPENPEPWEPASWPVGGLVAISGTNPVCSRAVEPELVDGDPQIPADACMALDDEVTR